VPETPHFDTRVKCQNFPQQFTKPEEVEENRLYRGINAENEESFNDNDSFNMLTMSNSEEELKPIYKHATVEKAKAKRPFSRSNRKKAIDNNFKAQVLSGARKRGDSRFRKLPNAKVSKKKQLVKVKSGNIPP
jgi:hypothetical protein